MYARNKFIPFGKWLDIHISSSFRVDSPVLRQTAKQAGNSSELDARCKYYLCEKFEKSLPQICIYDHSFLYFSLLIYTDARLKV